MKPLVSVIVVTYNQEEFVSESLDSIITQDYPNFEICVTDDCSTDKTADIIANYIVFRSGDSYNELMRKVFQDKVKIAYPVSYEKHNKSYTGGKLSNFNGRPETLASYSFSLNNRTVISSAFSTT